MSSNGPLVPVHGGLSEPVDRIVPVSKRQALSEEAASLPSLTVSAADLSTVYRIGDGALSPLEGPMKQEVYDDAYGLDAWDLRHSSRCFVTIANSLAWFAATGERPPTRPPLAADYTAAGLPWFDYYDDTATVSAGSKILNGLKTVAELGKEKGQIPLPENASVNPENVVKLTKKSPYEVRDGEF